MIAFNNGVTNILNTPGIISDDIANRPAADNVAVGTIFIATAVDGVCAMYQTDGTTWNTVGGGSGTTPGIDSVLAVNQVLTANRDIDFSTFTLFLKSGANNKASFNNDQINIGSSPNLLFDFNLATINTQNAGINKGLFLDFDNNQYWLGDESYFFQADSTNLNLLTFTDSSKYGLQVLGESVWLGDYDGSRTYNTTLNIDNTNGKFTIDNIEELILTGTPLITGSSGGSSGDHLVIRINGTQYVIALLNP